MREDVVVNQASRLPVACLKIGPELQWQSYVLTYSQLLLFS